MQTKTRTATKTETLFQQGYRIEPVAGQFGSFKVYNDTTGRYLVDALANTCDCPDFQFGQRKSAGYLCKHLTGLRALVTEQIADLYREQEAICEDARFGRMSKEKSREMGQSCINLADALESIENNLWGSGEFFVPVQFQGSGRRVAA